jgi:hypothetical protein
MTAGIFVGLAALALLRPLEYRLRHALASACCGIAGACLVAARWIAPEP